MRFRYAFAALLCLLALLTGAAKTETYMPGAFVVLELELATPADWAFNPDVPLSLKFDEAALKSAHFKVDKDAYSFKLKGHDNTYKAELPIKISESFNEQKLDVPLKLNCSICTKDNSRCTLVKDDIKVSVNVTKSGKPAKKGKLATRHLLDAPL